MITVNDILNFLNSRFPTDTACDFDNVGLLVGDKSATVENCIVALDCCLETVEFAKSVNANLIVTHHPVIFNGIKSITDGSTVFSALNSGISVISMHTNLDIGDGGVNDALCEILSLSGIEGYTSSDGYLLKCGSVSTISPDSFAEHIKNALGGNVRYSKGSRNINRVLVCSGSGGNFLYDAIAGGFDALVTADVKHNLFVDAINADISLYDAGHFTTEDIIVPRLCEMLTSEFNEISFKEFHTQNIRFI